MIKRYLRGKNEILATLGNQVKQKVFQASGQVVLSITGDSEWQESCHAAVKEVAKNWTT